MVPSDDSVFDQTVLGLIEKSPDGVVPHTPVYDEAISRLLRAGQIYLNADHPGGYVTARALSKLPQFAASNLEASLAENEGASVPEPNLSVFERYFRSLNPAQQTRAESFRVALAGHPVHHRNKEGAPPASEPLNLLFFVPGGSSHRTLPGNYLHGFLKQGSNGSWELRVADAERASARFASGSKAEVYEKYQEVSASAPFLLGELETLGFRLG